MLVDDRTEHSVPVRSTEVSGRAQGGNCVLLGTDIVNNDVVHVVFLYLGGEVDVDLDTVLRVLFFDGVQERMEPLGGTEVTDNPCEVDLKK